MTTRSLLTLLAFITVLMAIGAGIGYVTNLDKDAWYDPLVKSTLTPPDWVFGVVWPALYLMIAVAGFLFWQNRKKPGGQRVLALFALQMLLNWGWSFAFFTFHLLLLSWIWIGVLVLMVAATIQAGWRVSRAGSFLLIPYLAWISFATYLAGTIWWLNT